MEWLSAASTLLDTKGGAGFGTGFGTALGSAFSTPPAGPSYAGGLSNPFDASGWNVNFGAGSIEATRSQAGNFDQWMPYIIAGVGVLIVWRLTRKA